MYLSVDIFDLIGQAIEAAYRPDRWEAICDQVTTGFDATNFILLSYDPEEATGSRVFASENFRQVARNLGEDILSGAAEADNDIYLALLQAQPYQFASESATLGLDSEAEIISNPFRDAVLDKTGAKTRYGGKLNDVGPFLDVATMHFPHSDPLPTGVTETMHRLMPIFGKALETGRIIERLTRRYYELLSAFDLLDFGAVVAEDDGCILAANRRFGELERERDGLVPTSGVLAAATPEMTRKIRDLAQRATLAETDAADLIISLPRRSGRLPYIVKAAPIRSGDLSRRRKTLALLLIIDPEENGRIGAGGLEAFGLLSADELQVCDLLVRGMEASEISRTRDVSPSQTGAQIEALTSKLAVRSRMDLVRLAMATHAPMRKKQKVVKKHGTDKT